MAIPRAYSHGVQSLKMRGGTSDPKHHRQAETETNHLPVDHGRILAGGAV